MAEKTSIEWTDHTFNPWIGCTAVSGACDHCYAETLVKRWGGDFAVRRRTAESNWKLPMKWDRSARLSGVRRKVFCASLADVFDNQVPVEWRDDLFGLIADTPNLDWQLLTKRPQNIAKMLPEDWGAGWSNVWLGTTVENQVEADRRIPFLLDVPAVKKFLSCEPLLGRITFSKVPGFNRTGLDLWNWWVIVGGESGRGARPMRLEWALDIRDQCYFGGVPFFFKQFGEWLPDKFCGELLEFDDVCPGEELHGYAYDEAADCWRVGKKKAGSLLDGIEHKAFPA